MNSGTITNQLLDAVQVIVEDAVNKAEYDKTVQAIIAQCISATQGKYSVKYLGGYFEAFAQDPNTVYTPDTQVYVLIPGNNMSKTKTILGTVDKLGQDFIDENNNIVYEYNGNNICLNSATVPYELHSYLVTDGITLYEDGQTLPTNFTIDPVAANFYLNNSDYLMIAANIKAVIPQGNRGHGNYGIKYTITFTDSTSGEDVDREFILDINNMLGNPLNQPVVMRQSAEFKIDPHTYKKIKKIELFSKDFVITSNSSKPADIFISDLELLGINLLLPDGENGYAMSIITDSGAYFDENITEKRLEAKIYKNNRIQNNAPDEVAYYWFKENGSIYSDNEKYVSYGGNGWECLNDYIIESEQRIYKTSNNYINIAKSLAPAEETNFKCVAVYQKMNLKIERLVVLYNKDADYKVSLTSSNGTITKAKNTTLTCTVEGLATGTHVNYYWSEKVDDKTNYTEISTTSVPTLTVSLVKAIEKVFYRCTVRDEDHQMIVGSAIIEITRGENIANFISVTNNTLEELQDQIDGNITTWFYNYAPTLLNEPASNWTTDTDKDNHLGDLFYNTITGYCYRFMKVDGTYSWGKLSDSDISAALQAAQEAQDTADNKRRVFVTDPPEPPYDEGDLWLVQATNDIYRCCNSRQEGQYFSSDWIPASKYTDDSALNNLKPNLIISTLVEYALSESTSEAPQTGWSTSAPEWETGKYMWQRTTVTYADSTQENPHIVIYGPTCIAGATGQQGAAGADAYTVILSNESHTFAATNTAAIGETLTVTPYVYKGMIQQTGYTIGNITGTVTGLTATPTTTAPRTITIKSTTALTTQNGVLTIPITIDGKTFNKQFSWSLAKAGSNGQNGTSPTAYNLVVSHAAIVKTKTNTYSPTSITFYATSQTGDAAINTYVGGSYRITKDNGTPGNWINLLNSNSYNVSSNAPTTSIKIELSEENASSSTHTIIDTQTLPIVVDGVDGTNGKSVEVKTTTYSYCSSQSPQTPPSSGWSPTPSVVAGEYLWTKIEVAYVFQGTSTSAGSSTSYTVTYIGEDGTSILSVTPLYYLTDNLTAPVKPSSHKDESGYPDPDTDVWTKFMPNYHYRDWLTIVEYESIQDFPEVGDFDHIYKVSSTYYVWTSYPIESYNSINLFPEHGEAKTIYLDISTNISYKWVTNQYVVASDSDFNGYEITTQFYYFDPDQEKYYEYNNGVSTEKNRRYRYFSCNEIHYDDTQTPYTFSDVIESKELNEAFSSLDSLRDDVKEAQDQIEENFNKTVVKTYPLYISLPYQFDSVLARSEYNPNNIYYTRDNDTYKKIEVSNLSYYWENSDGDGSSKQLKQGQTLYLKVEPTAPIKPNPGTEIESGWTFTRPSWKDGIAIYTITITQYGDGSETISDVSLLTKDYQTIEESRYQESYQIYEAMRGSNNIFYNTDGLFVYDNFVENDSTKRIVINQNGISFATRLHFSQVQNPNYDNLQPTWYVKEKNVNIYYLISSLIEIGNDWDLKEKYECATGNPEHVYVYIKDDTSTDAGWDTTSVWGIQGNLNLNKIEVINLRADEIQDGILTLGSSLSDGKLIIQDDEKHTNFEIKHQRFECPIYGETNNIIGYLYVGKDIGLQLTSAGGDIRYGNNLTWTSVSSGVYQNNTNYYSQQNNLVSLLIEGEDYQVGDTISTTRYLVSCGSEFAISNEIKFKKDNINIVKTITINNYTDTNNYNHSGLGFIKG